MPGKAFEADVSAFVCVRYLLLALWEMSRPSVPFFSHSLCFKPFDLRGCGLHLLPTALGLTWARDTGAPLVPCSSMAGTVLVF